MKTLNQIQRILILSSFFSFLFVCNLHAQLMWVDNPGYKVSNAVPGGNESGRDVDICSCNYQGGIHPGKVINNKCNIGWGGKEIVVSTYKILIQSGGHLPKWVSTQGSIPQNAVGGGREGNNMFYIGRVTRPDGSKHTGKVWRTNGKLICNYGFGGKELTTETFEILTWTYANGATVSASASISSNAGQGDPANSNTAQATNQSNTNSQPSTSNNTSSPLQNAIQSKNTQQVAELLETTQSIDAATLEMALRADNYSPPVVNELLSVEYVKVSAKSLESAVEKRDLELLNSLLAKDMTGVKSHHFTKAMEMGRKDMANRLLSTKMISPGEKELISVIDAGDFIMLNEMIDLHGANPNVKVLNHAIEKQATSAITKILRRVKPDASSFEIAAKKNDDLMYGDLTMESRIPNNSSIEIAMDNNNMTILKDGLANGGNADQALTYALSKGNNQAVDYLLTRDDVDGNKALGYAVENEKSDLLNKLLNELDADADAALALAVEKNATDLAVICLQTGRTNPTPHIGTTLEKNNDELARNLVEYGGDPNEGMSMAIAQNKQEMVDFLINASADPTPLEYMQDAAEDNMMIVQLLVQAGADPNNGMVAAATNNQLATVNYLLSKNASPDRGMMPAVQGNFTSVVLSLLEAGASPEGYIQFPARFGNLDLVKRFISLGIDANKGIRYAVEGNHAPVVSYLLEQGASAIGHVGKAAEFGNVSMTTELLNHGADPENGMKAGVSHGHTKVVGLLIDRGADGSKSSYLLTAVQKNHAGLVQVLHDAGGDIHQQFPDGGSLLHKAVVVPNSLNTTSALTSLGINLNLQDNMGNTALHLAAERGKEYLPVVELLLASGAQVNLENLSGDTPLKVAKSRKVKKALKDKGASK